jgi:hypothetical protein
MRDVVEHLVGHHEGVWEKIEGQVRLEFGKANFRVEGGKQMRLGVAAA